MDFLSRIWSFICDLPPFVILDETEGGVRLLFGKYQKTLGPGIYWRWPIIHDVLVCKTPEQVVDLPSQVIRNWAVETTIRYRVVDPKKAILNVLDFDDSIINYTIGEIGMYLQRCLDDTYFPLDLRPSILEALKKEAEHWGIEILDFKVSTVSKARVFRLLGDL